MMPANRKTMEPTEANAPEPAPEPAAPALVVPVESAPPPGAAQIVIEGEQTEETFRLRHKLAEAEARLIKAQKDAAYLADENRRLKTVPTPPPPTDKRGVLEKFMAGENVWEEN